MNAELRNKILTRLESMDGKVGFYFKNLVTGETVGYNEKEQFLPASIVKVPLLAAMMLMRERGETDFRELITVPKEEMRPGCGAVQHMTGDESGAVTLDINTLYRFMIVISDTTATNALYKHYGNDKIIDPLKELGFKGTQFNRAYYDSVREEAGIQNYFVPEEMGDMFEKMYNRTLISKKASEDMENILLLQQINHKMGGRMPEGFPIAHKTGEDDDLSNDVGIVYAKQPFIVCFAGHDTKVSQFEDLMRHVSADLYRECNR